MGSAGKYGDKALQWAPQRTIPSSRKAVAVNTTGSQDLTAVTADDGPDVATARDLRGVFIYLSASGADITIQRGNAPATAGKGFVLVAGAAPQEFFVDAGPTAAENTLHAISAASAELHIMWDDQQVT